MRTEADQKTDDVFRDKLLGSTCFCGASRGIERRIILDEEDPIRRVIFEEEAVCAPLKCLAHGYCEAHSTPVSAQMSDDDKVRVMKRAGWMQG
jgi:hypothetical protein